MSGPQSADEYWGTATADAPPKGKTPSADDYWGSASPPPAPKPGLLERAGAAIKSITAAPPAEPVRPGEPRRGGTRAEAKPFVATGRDTTAGDVAGAAGDALKGMAGMAGDAALNTASGLVSSEGSPYPEPDPLEGNRMGRPLAYPQAPIEAASGASIDPTAQPAYQARAAAPAEASPMPLGADLAARLRQTTTNPVARGAASGFAQLGQTGVGAVRLAADLFGADKVADFASETNRNANQFGSAATVDLKGNDKLVADVTSSILNSAPAMAVGTIGGPALRTLFGQTALAEYSNGRDAGFSPEESLQRAGIFGAAEAVGERFGFSEQIKLLRSLGKHVPTGQLAKAAGEMLAKEIPGEQLTTLIEFLADKAGPAALQPNATLADYLDQAGETLKVTVAQTAVMGGGPAAIGTTRNALQRADQTIANTRPAQVDPHELIANAIDEAAAAYGLSPKAAAALRDQTKTYQDPGQAVAYVGRALDALERRNLVKKPGAAAGFQQTLAEKAQAAQEEAAPPAPAPAPSPAAAPAPRFDAGAILAGDTPAAAPAPTGPIEGQPINRNWSAFTPESGTLGIPREQMPQIKAEHRGALVNFLNARGVEHQEETVDPSTLTPTQAEFSPKKVQAAVDYTGGNRAVLVSQDGRILDGTHQWLAARDAGEPIRVIRLQAPIQDLLRLAHQFPSSYTAGGSGRAVSPGAQPSDTASPGGPGAVDAGPGAGNPNLDRSGPAAPDAARPAASAESSGNAGDVRPGGRDDALKAGQAVTLNGTPYTVQKMGKAAVTLVDATGKTRAIAKNSKHWPNIKPAAAATPAAGPRVIGKVGRMPNTAETVELRPNKDGTLTPYQGKYAMTDYETDKPIVVPANVTDEQAVEAIKKAGAVSTKDKWFGVQKDTASVAPESATPTSEGEANGQIEGQGRQGQGRQGLLAQPSEPSSSEQGAQAGIGVPAPRPAKIERSRLTPLDDPRLKSEDSRQMLEGARADIGWAQKGGQLIRDPRTAIDPNSPDAHREGDVIGRTPWIGSDLWRNRPEEGGKISETEAHQAIDRALAGEPMTAKQKRFVQYALDREAAKEWAVEGEPVVNLDTLSPEVREATDRLLANAIEAGIDAEALQEDIAKQTEGQSEHEFHAALQAALDEALARNGRADAQIDAGATRAGDQGGVEDHGARGPPGEGEEARPGLTLQAETEAEAQAKADREAAAIAAEKKAKEDAKRKAQVDAQVGDFRLTGSDRAVDVGTAGGQQDLLAAPAAPITDVGEKIGGARKDLAEGGETRTRRASTQDERPAWARRFKIAQIVKAAGRIDSPRDEGRWVISDSRSTDFMGQPKQVGRQTFATKEEAEAFVPIAAVGLKHRAVATRDGKYEIWRDISDRKRVKVVDKQFDTRDEAMAYMVSHPVQIIETNTTFGEADMPLPPDRKRTGPERRKGDVQPEDFAKTFGFRGVEFGNWNNQIERQGLMNDAWDGLMDLADVLNVPPLALGLNGDLALAFGARGHGLSSARAHYEPDRAVINLTKESGAGSLAHEWFHGLDHYFARQDGKASATWEAQKDGTRTLKIAGDGSDMASSGFRGDRSGVRAELRSAYDTLMRTMFKKGEGYVEDTAKADQFTARAKEDLAQQLDSLRRSLAETAQYGSRKAPATAEQLAEFDTIAKAMLDGDMATITTDWRTVPISKAKAASRWTNDSLERLSAIYKEVRGRSGFDSTNRRGIFDNLRGYMERYSQRLKMLADAQSGAEKTRMVPTDFAMNAKELDQGRGTDYWTTPHEMAARAFQGYVEDKIAERGGVSRFLNYGPENAGIPTPWGFKRPFPAGQERVAINKAFDAFVGELKTKETDSGVALLSRTEPFYSELSRQIETAPLVQGTAESWAQLLQGWINKGKVKADEVEWSGIKEWMALQPGKVTKQQVVDYLDANGVKVTETVLGQDRPDYRRSLRQSIEAAGYDVEIDMDGTLVALVRRSDDVAFEYNGNTESWDAVEDTETPMPADIQAQARELGQQQEAAADDNNGTKYGTYTLPGGTNYREVLLTLQNHEKTVMGEDHKGRPTWVTQTARENYKSGHWVQPNILAHIRVNDRTDAEGRKVLFVEELQSDWAQTGKKGGFQVDMIPQTTIWQAVDTLDRFDTEEAAQNWIRRNPPPNPGDNMEARLVVREVPEGGYDVIEEQRSTVAMAPSRGGVPRAPFVDKTDKWLALALKRIVKMAVDEGYDRVAFVNGDQSADRYSLAKQIKKVELHTRPVSAKGTNSAPPTEGTLRAWTNEDTTAIDERIPLDKLGDYIGKEVADRLLASPVSHQTGYGNDVRQLEGLDLKVGGEGMRAFYDKIVPAAAKEVLRKLGGQLDRVAVPHEVLDYQRTSEYVGPIPTDKQVRDLYELSKQNGPDVRRNPITGRDEPFAINRTIVEGDLRKLTHRLNEGIPFDVAIVHPDISEYTATMFGGMIERTTAKPDVIEHPGFDITDTMRAKAANGLPLFKRGSVSGLDITEARAVAAQLQDMGVRKIHVAATVQDMPPARRDAILAKDKQGHARGAFFPKEDEVWVVASNLRDANDMAFVVLHEAFHRGLQVTFGEEGGKLLRQIYATNKKVRDLADANMRRFKIGVEEATNEALADLAGKGEAKGIRQWDRLLKMIREWLGKVADAMGIKLRFTDDMVESLVAGLTRAGLQGEPSVNTAAAAPALSVPKQTETPAFQRWFEGSKVVDSKGEPLVVYHGTDKDFTEFVSRSDQRVWRQGGKELERADSWDFNGDYNARPQAYHYGTLSDLESMSPEKALAFRRAELKRLQEHSPGEQYPDSERRVRDLERLVSNGGAITKTVESRPSNVAPYFTPDTGYSFVAKSGGWDGKVRAGGNVMPVYLAIKNPIYLDASAIESAGWKWEKYAAEGYDGAIFAGNKKDLTQRDLMGGSTQIVAFKPEQIKSAIGNNGNFDPNESSILLSRAGDDTVAADHQEAAAVKKGYRARVKASLARFDSAVNGLGGLPDTDQFLAQRYRALGKIAAIDKVAGEIRHTFRKATPDDKKAVYAYLTERGANPDTIHEPDVRQLAVDTKAYINTVGDALVQRGLLPEESREEYRDRYLPRLYLSHLLDEGDWRAMGAGKKVSNLGYLKARKDIPQEVRDVLLGEVKDPAFLAATAIARPMRDMALLDWLDQISQNDKWIAPESMTTWNGRKVSAFWLKAEAEALRERARHYPEPANRTKATEIAEKMEAQAKEALGNVDFHNKDFRQIPDQAKFGRLRGLLVRKEIYDDLMGTQDFIPKDPGWAQKILGYGGLGTKATQLWKMSKVALNPPGQIRNAISNAVMLQLSGVPLHRMPDLMARAILQIRNNGVHWQVAQKYGVTESTFQAQELFRAKRDLLDLERDLKGMTPLVAIKSVAAAIADFAGDAYQATEAMFKTVKIIDAMTRQGLSEEQAALEAQKWLFDYSLLDRNLRYARNAPVGAPFVTFTSKVLPRLAEVALLAPHRFLPWVGLMYGMQMAAQAAFGGDDDEWEQLKKALPKWMQDKGHMAFLPWRDDAGRLQAVDLSYFFPWAQWTELAGKLAEADVLGAIKSLGIFGGPLPDVMTAMRTNEDPFTGRDIVNPDDPPMERAASLTAYAYDLMAPPFLSSNGVVSPMWLLGPEYGGKLAQASTGATNRQGDQKSTFGQAASRLVGMNVYGIDPELTREQNLAVMRLGMQKVAQRLKSKLHNQGLTDEQKETLIKDYMAEIEKRGQELDAYEKVSKPPAFARREATAAPAR